MKKTKWFRKIAALLLMLILILSMATGCAGASGKKNQSQQTRQETQQVQQDTRAESAQDTDNAGRNTASGSKDKSDKNKKTSSDDSEEDAEENDGKKDRDKDEDTVREDGEYSSKEEVAEYLHLYEHLPDNYLTKNEAKDLGWDSSKGNLWEVAPGKSIGGDRFGNREGLLPDKKGRQYFECDIDYEGGRRNGKRIVFSNDGLIYYTDDHYQSYELLYGEE